MDEKEIPDGTTAKMRRVVSSMEDVEAAVEELDRVPYEGSLWRRPQYWWMMRRVRKHVRQMALEARVTEKVVRAHEWEMPVALTPGEARHAKKTGAPLKRAE